MDSYKFHLPKPSSYSSHSLLHLFMASYILLLHSILYSIESFKSSEKTLSPWGFDGRRKVVRRSDVGGARALWRAGRGEWIAYSTNNSPVLVHWQHVCIIMLLILHPFSKTYFSSHFLVITMIRIHLTPYRFCSSPSY